MNPALSVLTSRFPEMAPLAGVLTGAYEMFRDTFRSGHQVFLCGNGGSAADAEHWAGELIKGFHLQRPLPPEKAASLPPELAERLQGGLPAIPLTGFTSVRSAVANDIGWELDFAQLLWVLGRPGDALVGISTSGRAANVRAAIRVARSKGLWTLLLTGQDGPQEIADLTIRAPSRTTPRIQEYHVAIYHAFSEGLENEFFGCGLVAAKE
jgi:D-sedoheptulose 7-phosphate isomerase